MNARQARAGLALLMMLTLLTAACSEAQEAAPRSTARGEVVVEDGDEPSTSSATTTTLSAPEFGEDLLDELDDSMVLDLLAPLGLRHATVSQFGSTGDAGIGSRTWCLDESPLRGMSDRSWSVGFTSDMAGWGEVQLAVFVAPRPADAQEAVDSIALAADECESWRWTTSMPMAGDTTLDVSEEIERIDATSEDGILFVEEHTGNRELGNAGVPLMNGTYGRSLVTFVAIDDLVVRLASSVGNNELGTTPVETGPDIEDLIDQRFESLSLEEDFTAILTQLPAKLEPLRPEG